MYRTGDSSSVQPDPNYFVQQQQLQQQQQYNNGQQQYNGQPQYGQPQYAAASYTAPQQTTSVDIQPMSTEPSKPEDAPEKGCCGKEKKPPTPEQKARKRKIDICVAVISAVASFVLLILAIVAYVEIAQFSSAYLDTVDTWQTKPVTSLMLGTAGACPPDSTPLKYTWPGTYDGCKCTPIESRGNNSDVNACPDSTVQSGDCATYWGLPAVPVDLFNGETLCFRRGGQTAVERPLPVTNTSCPTGYQMCGEGEIEDKTCVKNGDACPITDFVILASKASNTTYGSHVTEMKIGGTNNYLYYTTKGSIGAISGLSIVTRSPGSFAPNGLPIVDLELVAGVDGGKQCYVGGCTDFAGRSQALEQAANNYKARTINKGWKLRAGDCTGCKADDDSKLSPNGIDIRYVTAIDVSESSVFSPISDTSIPNEYHNLAPASAKISLLYRQEIPWRTDCPRSRKDAIDKQDTVTNVRSFQLVLLILSIFCLIVLTCYIPYMEIKKPEWAKNKRNARCTLCLKVITKAVLIAFTIATMVLCLQSLGFWSDIDGSKVNEPPSDPTGPPINYTPCADPLTSEIFKKLNTQFKSLSNKDIASFVSTGADGAVHGAVALFDAIT